MGSFYSLRFGRHALVRMKQRAFSPEVIESILDYGSLYHAGDGCSVYWLSRRDVAGAWKRYRVRLDCYTNAGCVVAPDGSIRSTYRAGRRRHHWRRGRP